MDIDIDLQTTFDPSRIFPKIVKASMVKDGRLTKHPCGHYLQTVPVDSVTKLAAIPHERAADFGFFKIDFLHLSLLNAVESKAEIRELINKEPDWRLLQNPVVVAQLFQLSKHYELINQIRPSSVMELADCVAMIRPNKRHLLEKYLADKKKVRPLLFKSTTDDKSSFRKCHAIAYALTIVLQLHLIKQGRISLT